MAVCPQHFISAGDVALAPFLIPLWLCQTHNDQKPPRVSGLPPEWGKMGSR